jgi:hypothetical protein
MKVFLLDERSRLGHFNVVGREDAGPSADYARPTNCQQRNSGKEEGIHTTSHSYCQSSL